jgi:hypothetical protein
MPAGGSGSRDEKYDKRAMPSTLKLNLPYLISTPAFGIFPDTFIFVRQIE